MIPGFNRLDIDAEGMKRKFGIMGDPLFLGVIVGCAIGALACKDGKELTDGIPSILGLGIKMGAVMELIPRITSLFIEGLRPISDATRNLIAHRFKNSASLNIGMSPALVIGHPTTLVVSLLLIPVILFLSVVLPGNQFLPLASLAGMFYLFPAVLPHYERKCTENIHHRTGEPDCRTVFRDRPGTVFYASCSGRICQNRRHGRKDSGRLQWRRTRLRVQHILMDYLSCRIPPQDYRFCHSGHPHFRTGYL